MSNNNSHYTILVCQGTGCVSSLSPQIQNALESEIVKNGLQNTVTIKLTGCHGFCQRGPIVIIEPEGFFYCEVKPEDAHEIVQSHLINGKPVTRLFYTDPETKQPIPYYRDIKFYNQQERVILRNCGHINPESLEDYLQVGGYIALKKVLREMTPEQVIDEVKKSGLRGRGGAGFPTGTKWSFCKQAISLEKYIICNADEGDPGAFMDRSILEADPHAVVEGMTIAAYAIGASEGYVYVRAEYPLAVKRLKIAITEAEKQGYLGKNILNSKFNFNIKLIEGAGAFVCGEETALIASIEGNRGMPRQRPPFPAHSGLWGKPTTINNVKTLACVPVIINKGAEWFASIGTENSKGTAVFALTGKVTNCGLVEIPMGATLRHVIFNIGGGIPNNRKLKAVQTGGPSGGCIPVSMIDLPVDYESLTKAGSMMGSGGMVVMDEDTCMVDVARYFLSFTQSESCGKCVPCRLGTKRMLEILTRITEGKGKEEDIEKLTEMAITIKDSSLCGLGQTAPNPVLTTIRYFKDEYLEHIINKHCPAGVCQALIKYVIIEEKCIGCGACAKICPQKAISGEKKKPHKINIELCIKCGACRSACKKEAIEVK